MAYSCKKSADSFIKFLCSATCEGRQVERLCHPEASAAPQSSHFIQKIIKHWCLIVRWCNFATDDNASMSAICRPALPLLLPAWAYWSPPSCAALWPSPSPLARPLGNLIEAALSCTDGQIELTLAARPLTRAASQKTTRRPKAPRLFQPFWLLRSFGRLVLAARLEFEELDDLARHILAGGRFHPLQAGGGVYLQHQRATGTAQNIHPGHI